MQCYRGIFHDGELRVEDTPPSGEDAATLATRANAQLLLLNLRDEGFVTLARVFGID